MKSSKKLIFGLLCLMIIMAHLFSGDIAYPITLTSISLTERLAGSDRYQTAIAISQKGWATSEYAVLARGDDFADALCAGPLAGRYGAPILLTQPNELNRRTLEELKRLGTTHLLITGGPNAIAPEVEASLKSGGIGDIQRIFGSNRFQTSVRIAEHIGGVKKIILATGNNYPDALSISGIASNLGIPILLTKANSLPMEVNNYLNRNGIEQTYIIGGTSAINKEIERIVPAPVRISGQNRYETNVAIIRHFEKNLAFDQLYIAVGQGPKGNEFADALTGAMLAARNTAPVILVNETLPMVTANYLQTKVTPDSKVIAFGGEKVVASSILNSILASENYATAGTFGPDINCKTVKGNVVISTAGVTLQNIHVQGHLILAEGIGNGDITLKNVTVEGLTIVKGGGQHSVIMYNFQGQNVIIDVPDGHNVRLVADGGTNVAGVTMNSAGYLEENDISGSGFLDVFIQEGVTVNLAGSFGQVRLESPDSTVRLTDGSISSLDVSSNAGGASIHLANGTIVTALNIEAASTVTGQGQISAANINSAGTSIAQTPATIHISSGLTANINGQERSRGTIASGGSGGNGGGGDTTPPSFTAAYPQAGAGQADSSRQVEILVQADEDGTAYYVVVPDNDPAPSTSQVMAGQDGSGQPALAAGNVPVPADITESFVTAALPADATDYDIYVVLQDASDNASATAKVDVTTPAAADTTPPSFTAAYPQAGAGQANSSRQVEILVQADEDGTAYYVVVPDNDPAPSTAQVMAGQDASGQPALAAGSVPVPADIIESFLTAALPEDATDYDVYVVLQDASDNASTAAKVDVTTPAAGIGPEFVNFTFNMYDDSPDIRVEFYMSQEITSLNPGDFRIGTTAAIPAYNTFDKAIAISSGETRNKLVILKISGENVNTVRGFGTKAKLLINPANSGNDVLSTSSMGLKVQTTGLLTASSGNKVFADNIKPVVLYNLNSTSVYASNTPDTSGNGYSWADIQFTEEIDMTIEGYYADDFIFRSQEQRLAVKCVTYGKAGADHSGANDPTRIRFYFENGSIGTTLNVRADAERINIRDLAGGGSGDYNIYLPSQEDIDGFDLTVIH